MDCQGEYQYSLRYRNMLWFLYGGPTPPRLNRDYYAILRTVALNHILDPNSVFSFREQNRSSPNINLNLTLTLTPILTSNHVHNYDVPTCSYTIEALQVLMHLADQVEARTLTLIPSLTHLVDQVPAHVRLGLGISSVIKAVLG